MLESPLEGFERHVGRYAAHWARAGILEPRFTLYGLELVSIIYCQQYTARTLERVQAEKITMCGTTSFAREKIA